MKDPKAKTLGMTLSRVLTREKLEEQADPRSFERGVKYLHEQRVGHIRYHADRIAAPVQGKKKYQASLWPAGHALGHSCTCPVGTDGRLCKHCIALGLAWILDSALDGTKARRPVKERPDPLTMGDVREYLDSLDKPALVRMLSELADSDDALYEKLEYRAMRSRAGSLEPKAVRAAITKATSPRRFIDWRHADDFAGRISVTAGLIRELLDTGRAADALHLTEHALHRVEDRVLGSIDDSSGCMGTVIAELQELHHDACQAARPEPVGLASRLFEWESSSDWGLFCRAAETYQDVLGDSGLAEYRRLAQAAWNRPGPEPAFWLRLCMETLARLSGDVDELAAVKTRTLDLPYSYLEVAEVYEEAGRREDARAWAEKGVKAFPDQVDDRLHEFLAGIYLEEKRTDDALELFWQMFAHDPDVRHFQRLGTATAPLGRWPESRRRALDFLKRLAEVPASRRSRYAESGRVIPDEAVRILLLEDEVEAAWEMARILGCGRETRLELTGRHENAHPEEAILVYQGMAQRELETSYQPDYSLVVDLMTRTRRVMKRLGQQERFAQYVAEIRRAWRRKRNLMRLIARAFPAEAESD